MSKKVIIKWHGDKVLNKAYNARDLALTEIAIDVHRYATEEVPVDMGRLKGSLAYSVDGQRPEGSSPVAESEAEDSKISSKKGMAIVGTNVVYAAKMEFGGSKVKAPNGYLRISSDRVKPTIPGIVKKYFRKELG